MLTGRVLVYRYKRLLAIKDAEGALPVARYRVQRAKIDLKTAGCPKRA